MRSCATGLSLVLLGATASGALAQLPASFIQLPSRSHFTTGTTVWVPDRGSAYLGGVQRATSHRTKFGLPLLPAWPHSSATRGGMRSASSMHVKVTVHDFAAMDEYLLGQPTRFSQSLRSAQSKVAVSTVRATTRPPNQVHAPIRKPRSRPGFGNPPPMSAAAARAMYERGRAALTKEAADLLQRGRQAEASGKAGVARIYYQMAARRATGELKQRALSRLAVLR